MNNPIECPKCHERSLYSTSDTRIGKEFFCWDCKDYFGLIELVTQWDYDAGDLFGGAQKINTTYKSRLVSGEPFWFSMAERQDAYQMVNRMLLGITEIDDYMDLHNTQMGVRL